MNDVKLRLDRTEAFETLDPSRGPSMLAPRIRGLVSALLLVASGIAGCAQNSAAGDGTAAGAQRGSGSAITAEELAPAELQRLDAYSAVERLRSQWLRTRGTDHRDFRVVVDGTPRTGELRSVLESLRVSDIQELRLLGAQDAAMRFGSGFGSGAILVTTKR